MSIDRRFSWNYRRKWFRKNTFLDILTGLIKPVTGKILIDKEGLHTETWQNICGYVSQIYSFLMIL